MDRCANVKKKGSLKDADIEKDVARVKEMDREREKARPRP